MRISIKDTLKPKKNSLIRERERANDFGQFLNPFKKSFKMNSMAQANTDCCLEVSLELGLCEAPMLMVS
jgi:hypothetical protein